MSTIRRIYLFAKDYISEFGIAWSLARHNDCERNGGHHWSESEYDETMRAFGSTCSRCHCWMSSPDHLLPTPTATGPMVTTTYGGISLN